MKYKSLPLLLASSMLLSACYNQKEYSYCTNIDSRIERVLDKFKEESKDAKMMSVDHSMGAYSPMMMNLEETHWWDSYVDKSISESEFAIHKSIEDLLISSLKNSSQIRVFSDIPLIRETNIQEACGEFDTIAFLEARFNRENNPVGSDLIISPRTDDSRLEENDYSFEGGLRRKFKTGTEVELSQMIGRLDSNSTFLNPNPQGKAELKLRVIQPLMKGNGYAYNTTGLRIAQIDSQVACQEFIRQSQTHLLEIIRAYWNLYRARALFYQQKQLVNRTSHVLEALESRSALDASSTQIIRANAAFTQRKADLIRAEVAIRNAQDKIKTLINDPDMSIFSDAEIIPMDPPLRHVESINLKQAASAALNCRPEVQQSFKQLHASLLREKVSCNEMLPELNLFLEGRLRGLTGNDPLMGNAFSNEWSKGSPGGTLGLSFEFPIENNAAKARLRRRRLEIRQQTNQVLTTIETVLLEVKVTAREIQTAGTELVAKYNAMKAAREDLDALMDRRDVDIDSKNIETSAYLEFLLDSQERLTQAEGEFVDSIVSYNLAFANLQKAQGTLLCYEDFEIERTNFQNCIPKIELGYNSK